MNQQCNRKKYVHVLWMFLLLLLLSGWVKFAFVSTSDSIIGDSFQLDDLQADKNIDITAINQRFAMFDKQTHIG